MANNPERSEQQPVVITVLGKEYRIACPQEEKEGLIKAAAYLDEKMREIRDRGRTTGSDNIAVMAALNITHELIQLRTDPEPVDASFSGRVKQLQNKIEAALSDARQIEI